MSDYDLTRLVISICIIGLSFVFILRKVFHKESRFNAKFITSTAIFAAISTILYVVPFFNFNLPIFPAFLSIHLDEIPVFIAGFAYGPTSAIFILLIKTLIKLPMTSSLCVGEIADFIYSFAFIIPACLIYKKKRSFKGALISLGVGFICQVVVASFFTTFVMLDFYMFVMGMSYESILAMCQAIYPSINNLSWPFLTYIALPFNIVKDVIVIVVTLLLYKSLHTLIDRIAREQNKN